MTDFKIGDRIKVTRITSLLYGDTGTIFEIFTGYNCKYRTYMDAVDQSPRVIKRFKECDITKILEMNRNGANS